jgi:hypothetical protein
MQHWIEESADAKIAKMLPWHWNDGEVSFQRLEFFPQARRVHRWGCSGGETRARGHSSDRHSGQSPPVRVESTVGPIPLIAILYLY